MPATGNLIVETFNAAGSNTACDGTTTNTSLDLYGPDGVTLLAHDDNNALINPSIPSRLSLCSTIGTPPTTGALSLPPGTYYARVTSQGSLLNMPYLIKFHPVICGDGVVDGSEQCDSTPNCSASCVATAPGPGESLATPEPFPGCPTTPSSTVRLGVPSCFPTEGTVQWYSYVATDQALAVTSDASGPIALFNSTGTELSCSLDATSIPIATLSGAGNTVYVAVSLPSSITCLAFNDHPYTGLQGTLTNLNISIPSSTAGVPRLGIAVSATTIFMGNTLAIYTAPKAGNATATKPPGLTGPPFGYLGQDLNFENGWLFSLIQVSTDGSGQGRVKRLFNGTTYSAQMIWENPPAYPSETTIMPAFTYDGTNLIGLMGGFTTSDSPLTNTVNFFSYTVPTKSQDQMLAQVSPWSLMAGGGIAADSNYLYVAGVGPMGDAGAGPQMQGVYRFARANLSAPPSRSRPMAPGSAAVAAPSMWGWPSTTSPPRRSCTAETSMVAFMPSSTLPAPPSTSASSAPWATREIPGWSTIPSPRPSTSWRARRSRPAMSTCSSRSGVPANRHPFPSRRRPLRRRRAVGSAGHRAVLGSRLTVAMPGLSP
jgi:hypothetical protein